MVSKLATSVLFLSALNVLAHVFISNSLNTQTVICKAGVPLTGCQFMWRPITGNPGQVLDLSHGHRTIPNTGHLSGEVQAYSYSGRDLESGDCGVTLKIRGKKKWMIGCRVHMEGSGWSYAWMDLFADGWRVHTNTVTSRETVALQGDSVSLLVKALDPMRQCRFTPPGGVVPLNFDRGAESVTSSNRYRYLGTGLKNGECGLTIFQVSEADNGVGGAYLETSPTHDFRFMPVIVARTPSQPVLHAVVNGENDITATCKVERSRPIANITWYLGDDVIRDDRVDDSPANPNDEWRWPWIQGSITQKLTRKLQTKDIGKVLKCSVGHVTLAKPLEATHRISLTPTVPASLAEHIPCTCPDVVPCPNLSAPVCPATDELSTCTRKLQLLHQESVMRASGLHSTLPGDAGREAAATVAELSIEAAKVKLEAARASAEALARQDDSKALAADLAVESARSRAAADEAMARAEEAWALNAEEELLFERRRRSQLEKQLEDARLG